MSLKELINKQGEIPVRLSEEEKTKEVSLNDLNPLVDYRVVINFKGGKEAIFLGRMGKEEIYRELAENYMIDKDNVNDSNIQINVERIEYR